MVLLAGPTLLLQLMVTFNLGETDAVTLNPGDSTEVQVNVNGNSINGYGRTTVQFISNQGAFGNAEFRYTTFGLDVLVVDDDDGKNYEPYIENELVSLSSELRDNHKRLYSMRMPIV
ncbi:MAG: hypothetical protein MZV63_56700 [Marinilabiliales bacterium]|nr:hypothetical protein [Marinilabiliales bacterium]